MAFGRVGERGEGEQVDTPELAIDGMAVVVLGGFAPRKITARWLRQKDLIGAEDFESYDAEYVGPHATIGSFGSIQLKVLENALEVATEEPADVETARDLALGILLSKGTSGIAAMGINRTVHFAAELATYHAIGDTLTPKSVWNGLLHLPGMASVAIAGQRDDGYGGIINVQVQPSTKIQPGVFVSVNDHYTLTQTEILDDRDALLDHGQANPERSADKVKVAVQILTEGFTPSRNRANAIIRRVASFGLSQEED